MKFNTKGMTYGSSEFLIVEVFVLLVFKIQTSHLAAIRDHGLVRLAHEHEQGLQDRQVEEVAHEGAYQPFHGDVSRLAVQEETDTGPATDDRKEGHKVEVEVQVLDGEELLELFLLGLGRPADLLVVVAHPEHDTVEEGDDLRYDDRGG